MLLEVIRKKNLSLPPFCASSAFSRTRRRKFHNVVGGERFGGKGGGEKKRNKNFLSEIVLSACGAVELTQLCDNGLFQNATEFMKNKIK